MAFEGTVWGVWFFNHNSCISIINPLACGASPDIMKTRHWYATKM